MKKYKAEAQYLIGKQKTKLHAIRWDCLQKYPIIFVALVSYKKNRFWDYGTDS